MANVVRYQLRCDTKENWTAANPVLLKGELGLDLTANRMKMGDGVTAWNDLPYIEPEVIDTLSSTSKTKALSANRGSVLLFMMESLGEEIREKIPEITSNTNNYGLISSAWDEWRDLKNTTKWGTNGKWADNTAMSYSLGYWLKGKIPKVRNSIAGDSSSTSSSIEEFKTQALSAYQGIVLKELAESKADAETVTTLQETLKEYNRNLTTVQQNVTNLNTTVEQFEGVEVIDRLDQTDTDKALSANQGKVLNDKISQKADSSALTTLQTTVNNHSTTLSSLNTKVTNNSSTLTTLQQNVNNLSSTVQNINTVDVVNNLTSTSTTDALSGNQGRILNTQKLDKTAITSESWTFTMENGSTVAKKVVLWA